MFRRHPLQLCWARVRIPSIGTFCGFFCCYNLPSTFATRQGNFEAVAATLSAILSEDGQFPARCRHFRSLARVGIVNTRQAHQVCAPTSARRRGKRLASRDTSGSGRERAFFLRFVVRASRDVCNTIGRIVAAWATVEQTQAMNCKHCIPSAANWEL
jgi:hypothetical protein